MLTRCLWLAALLAVRSLAQESDTRGVVVLTGSRSTTSTRPEATYASITGQVTDSARYESTSTRSSSATESGSGSGSGSASGSRTGSESGSSVLTTSRPSRGSTSTITLLVGGGGIVTESVINGTVTLSASVNTTASETTSSQTATSATPTNTQPCNNYPEFCSRKYSNITEVCAHNSAFDIKGNAGSNQELSVTDQLNDGIRMIQGETQLVNGTIMSCHTTCDLLNAGTWQSELEEVAEWVRNHPYDVVTILIVNTNYDGVGNYTAPLQNSGLGPYLYEPPYIPMRLDDWPTLSEMILTQKRVVVFMDYEANQTEVPYILDEFTHMWETPFSPTDRAFPCTTQRPPDLDQEVARTELMYLANHNLNTEISLLGLDLLVPNTAQINDTNSAGEQYGELGAMANNCTEMWNRPPNFLLVDYYNRGDGSVFEVAAKHNNVTYTGVCCGVNSSGAANLKSSSLALVVALAAVFVFTF